MLKKQLFTGKRSGFPLRVDIHRSGLRCINTGSAFAYAEDFDGCQDKLQVFMQKSFPWEASVSHPPFLRMHLRPLLGASKAVLLRP